LKNLIEIVNINNIFNYQKNKDFIAAKNSLPPLWVEKIELAEEDISKIQNKSKRKILYS
jgi:hypothetical protein